MVRYGETTVLVNATASAKPRDGIDFLPLSVDFEEKLYAVGKIPGSFLKREGRPSDKAVLSSRVVDRPIRPLFPKDMRNDVSVVMTVLSVDPDCVAGNRWYDRCFHGAVHLRYSLEWAHRRHQCRSGRWRDHPEPPMPSSARRAIFSSPWPVPPKRSVMIEAGANEVDDDTMLEAIMKPAYAEVQKMVAFIKDSPGRDWQAQVHL